MQRCLPGSSAMGEKLLNFCIIVVGMIQWKPLMMSYVSVFFVLLGLLIIMTKINKNLNTSVISLIKYRLVKLLIVKYVVVVLGSPLQAACHCYVFHLSFVIFLDIFLTGSIDNNFEYIGEEIQSTSSNHSWSRVSMNAYLEHKKKER